MTTRPSLRRLNTFGVQASAGLLLAIESEEDVLSLPAFDPQRDLIVGGGSNILFVTDVPGTVLLNRIKGIGLTRQDEQFAWIDVGAGESWHKLVSWSVENQLSGIENLALIPGNAGAAPIQNIGAYGVELASVLESVTAWDLQTCRWMVLNNAECEFSYRDSVFKSAQAGRHLITSITLRLNKHFSAQLDYAGLQEELSACHGRTIEPADVYSAVIRLRQRKLPDPAVQGNAGSFFKNPKIGLDQLEAMRSRWPGLPSWIINSDCAKISAAWMIDQCRLKGLEHDGAAVSERHALVLLNLANATGKAIWELARRVQETVHDRFGILLEPEPLIYRRNG